MRGWQLFVSSCGLLAELLEAGNAVEAAGRGRRRSASTKFGICD